MRSLLFTLTLGLLHPAGPALAASDTRDHATPIPVATFAKAPLIYNVALSPDGKRVASLMNVPGGTALITQRTDGSDLRTVLSSDNKQMLFSWVRWVNNERMLASVRYRTRRQDILTEDTRLVAVDFDGGERLDMSQLPDSGMRHSQQIQDRVVDWLPGDGRHVLLEQWAPTTTVPAVYRVNIETGERRMVHSPQRGVGHWITDAEHRVRAGIRQTDDQVEIIVSNPDGSNWRPLWRYDLFSRDEVQLLGFDKDPNVLFIRADHEGRRAVFTVDLRDPGLKRTLRLAHPEQDLAGHLIRSQLSGEIVGFVADGDADGDAPSTEFWDPELNTLAEAFNKALPGRFNRLLGLSHDELRYLIYSSGNGIPGQYYIGDRESGRLTLLADQYEHLKPANLVGKQAIRITARDGTTMRAFLSRPKQRPTGTGPLVLLPHGGPHSRDDNDFDLLTEFLANRSYTVLQLNFRGSSGYGYEFEAAGLQRWGMEMQDDLTDAVKWAVATGIADPRQVCIVGGSYGGYAALMGAIKTPDLYRCAVSINGVTDLEELVHHIRNFQGGKAAARLQFGSFWSDSARLHDTSPVHHAERIQVPVMVLHGSDDRVVPVEHGRAMSRALKKAGKRYTYIELPGAGHHPDGPVHRKILLTALEEFLATHLKGDEEQ